MTMDDPQPTEETVAGIEGTPSPMSWGVMPVDIRAAVMPVDD